MKVNILDFEFDLEALILVGILCIIIACHLILYCVKVNGLNSFIKESFGNYKDDLYLYVYPVKI
jgi:hypothetical protein